jgi:hypothetical protein
MNLGKILVWLDEATQRENGTWLLLITYVGGPERSFDGGKKINGRKRHLAVDTQGRR